MATATERFVCTQVITIIKKERDGNYWYRCGEAGRRSKSDAKRRRWDDINRDPVANKSVP